MNTTKRATFGGKLGAILALAGGAVGLGNIWRFPYIAGENGGGAFLIIYVLCALLIGLPIMLAEFSIGRNGKSNPVGAFRKHHKAWRFFGYNCIFASLLILGFYCVVTGWTLEYTVHSLTNSIVNNTTATAHSDFFQSFITHPWRPLIYTVIALALTHITIILGVQNGIERMSKVLMPLLFIMLIVLAVRSIMLPGSGEGLRFFLQPDFSKVTGKTFLLAIGQSFFSLSIGIGTMITYASYFQPDTDIRKSAAQVTVIDTLVAILAGVVIFPAVFSAGIEPGSGPSLVFITLPSIFATLPLSAVWSTIFFILLAVAAITSVISIHEVVTAYIHEEWRLSRNRAAWLTSAVVLVLCVLASLSLGAWDSLKLFGMSLFDFLDFVTANIMLPIGGMMTALFAGWVVKRTIIHNELTNYDTIPCSYEKVLRFLLRYICPIAVALIFLDNLGFI